MMPSIHVTGKINTRKTSVAEASRWIKALCSEVKKDFSPWNA
jgi:hypothetical protein